MIRAMRISSISAVFCIVGVSIVAAQEGDVFGSGVVIGTGANVNMTDQSGPQYDSNALVEGNKALGNLMEASPNRHNYVSGLSAQYDTFSKSSFGSEHLFGAVNGQPINPYGSNQVYNPKGIFKVD